MAMSAELGDELAGEVRHWRRLPAAGRQSRPVAEGVVLQDSPAGRRARQGIDVVNQIRRNGSVKWTPLVGPWESGPNTNSH
jgi:hypothetical protein